MLKPMLTGALLVLATSAAFAEGPAKVDRAPDISIRCDLRMAGSSRVAQTADIFLFDEPFDTIAYSEQEGPIELNDLSVMLALTSEGLEEKVFLLGTHEEGEKTIKVNISRSVFTRNGVVGTRSERDELTIDRVTGIATPPQSAPTGTELTCDAGGEDFQRFDEAYADQVSKAYEDFISRRKF